MFNNTTIALIKSAALTVAASASIYFYGSMVTEYVVSKIETFFD